MGSLVKINGDICWPTDAANTCLLPGGLRRSKKSFQGHFLLWFLHWYNPRLSLGQQQKTWNIPRHPSRKDRQHLPGRISTPNFHLVLKEKVWLLGKCWIKSSSARAVSRSEQFLPLHRQASRWLIFLITSKIHGEFEASLCRGGHQNTDLS